MSKASIISSLAVVVGVSCMTGCTSRDGTPPGDQSLFDASELGTVAFPVSCNAAAQERMEHGLALLHHMMYTEADAVFQSANQADASCAMAYWGRAMTIVHPMWPDVPTTAQLERGAGFVRQAIAAGPATEREQAYVGAIEGYFRDAERRTEADRLTSFHAGWQSIHERFPEDREATAFHALATLALGEIGVADTRDAAETAVAEMKALLAEIPDHPGAHHYAVHAYDYMTPDDWAVAVARSYGKLAPEVPHALHMPTHIFSTLGLWSESIELNERSAKAAFEQGRRSAGLDNHYPHALGYLIYAYLQTGQDARAKQIVEQVTSVEGPFSELNRLVVAAHFAGIPVRYALERHAWDEAAHLEARATVAFPWEEYPQFDAVTYYGRAIGSARIGDAAGATAALSGLRSALAQAGPQGTPSWLIWDGQTLEMAATAWVDFARGDTERAIPAMEGAAERSLSGFPLGPGELLPAGEQLADMYLELGRHGAALTAYEAVLKRLPNRFNSLYGAGRAAELGGDTQQAMDYYTKLVEQASEADPAREDLRGARTYLASH